MILEWLRRHDPGFPAAFDTYLFTEGELTRIEEEAERRGEARSAEDAGAARKEGAAEKEQATRPPERAFTVGSLKPGR